MKPLHSPPAEQPQRLGRELGMGQAILLGMGSILGAGVFVSIGLASGIAGRAVVLAVAVGALVAVCNGLSSAQLAAYHPVSGGAYEYGYRFLSPAIGFAAGWMFLTAKSASAATAALGVSGYLLETLEVPASGWLLPLALVTIVALTAIVAIGIRSSNRTNVLIVSLTLGCLLYFIGAGLVQVLWGEARTPRSLTSLLGLETDWRDVLSASALMFVAYTGYGRIATMGEEVKDPRRTIPTAIIITLIATMTIYIAVAFVGIETVGPEILSGVDQRTAPLQVAAARLKAPAVSQVIVVGAVAGMLGVLLNLLLGLSRVLLAMGRRRDMPAGLGRLNESGTSPTAAVLAVGGLVLLLTLTGDVKLTWSFSAFTVLVYYAITNLAALFLPPEARLYPRWISALGLLACASLAFFVETEVWLFGLGVLAAGLLWRVVFRRLRPPERES